MDDLVMTDSRWLPIAIKIGDQIYPSPSGSKLILLLFLASDQSLKMSIFFMAGFEYVECYSFVQLRG
ncbi:hypothetical protein B0681_00720 [Moraxella porci DSM 25326]|uniref:Uncharacterized protein n=1 Tax=Moraxella porci DSM 25326 TaxID=573983 RepID=A0A1T0CVS6_9GAMM|nr:hypothetical protein B0681_00720 [Moraxella porci DSM 25326]